MDPEQDATVTRLVRATLAIFDGQPIDTVILALGEVLARVLAETTGCPEAWLACLHSVVRRWLAVLPPWHRSELPLQ
jgi:hypothetical protein